MATNAPHNLEPTENQWEERITSHFQCSSELMQVYFSWMKFDEEITGSTWSSLSSSVQQDQQTPFSFVVNRSSRDARPSICQPQYSWAAKDAPLGSWLCITMERYSLYAFPVKTWFRDHFLISQALITKVLPCNLELNKYYRFERPFRENERQGWICQ